MPIDINYKCSDDDVTYRISLNYPNKPNDQDSISFIEYEKHGEEPKIEKVKTSPNERRKGHALYLMYRLSSITNNKDEKSLIKTGHITGDGSENFYTKLGFKLVDTEQPGNFKTGTVTSAILKENSFKLLLEKGYSKQFSVKDV